MNQKSEFITSKLKCYTNCFINPKRTIYCLIFNQNIPFHLETKLKINKKMVNSTEY